MIEKFACRDFTAFDRLNVVFSPGVNILVGENGVGKTHLLKAAYALASAGSLKRESGVFDASLTSMLIDLFRPLDGKLANLRKWGAEGKTVLAADFSAGRRVSALFEPDAETVSARDDNYPRHYTDDPVYIPPRETISFLRGFVSLYARYDLPFDRGCRNIAVALDLPRIRPDKLGEHSRRVMAAIEKVCGGQFSFQGGGLVTYRSGEEEYAAAVTSEGFLQLGVLYRLLENGSIQPGESGPLFWDLPETSLNPKLLKVLAWILLELARNGQQIVLATHSYVLLKYFELLSDRARGDEVRYHSLCREGNGSVKFESVDNYNHLRANAIVETYLNLYDTELERALAQEPK